MYAVRNSSWPGRISPGLIFRPCSSRTSGPAECYQEEQAHNYSTVKPFHEIPGVELSPVRRIKKTILGLLGSEKTNSIDLHVNTIKKHGKLVRISASSLSGNLRTLLVLVARPEDIASVLRNIGPTPYRPNMEILKTTLEERNYVSGLIWT